MAVVDLEKWEVGKYSSVVVSNVKQENSNFPIPPNASSSTEEERDYYGGYLVCESIANPKTASLVASAPELRRMLNMFVNAIEGQDPDEKGHYTQTFGPAMLEAAKTILNKIQK
jgi:hypothetical protein